MSGHLLQERRDYIEKKLLAEGKIRVAELAEYFDVSTETIRKDLIYLQEKGIARKGYGGAVIANEFFEPSFIEKSAKNQSEKNRIADKVMELIEDGMVIMMDAGSTVCAVAKAIGAKKEITVFTNALKAAQVLDDQKVTTYVLGGQVRNNSNAIIGGWAIRSIQEVHADVAILGTSGFGKRGGPCVENFPEADIKKAMMQSANKIIVVGDATKAQQHAMIEFATWGDVDYFITDQRIESDILETLQKKTHVLVV